MNDSISYRTLTLKTYLTAEAIAVAQDASEEDTKAAGDEKRYQTQKKREEEERAREIARAQAMQASTTAPMKIRTDYVPKGLLLLFNVLELPY